MKTKKRIIEDFLKTNSIRLKPNTYLANDLQNNNWKALRFPAFAISRLWHLKNLKENILELAKIERKDNQSESKYYNKVTEFFGVWLISYLLKLKVVAMETKTLKINSPYASGTKSCDILAKKGKDDLYFEVKDLSKETLTREIDESCPEIINFTPPTPTQKNKWIKKMVCEAVKKGANFLICRIPAWNAKRIPCFGSKWLNRIFKNSKRVGKKEYLLKTELIIPDFFQGVYLIKNRRYLLLKF